MASRAGWAQMNSEILIEPFLVGGSPRADAVRGRF